MKVRRPLTSGWELRPGGGSAGMPSDIGPWPVAAAVPGCVHTDLLEAGLIPDPYQGDNEAGLGWIGRSRWEYATSFEWLDPDSRVDLVFEGLDTVATVVLNGTEVGRTANMHRTYRFEVTKRLARGVNHLTVTFEPPLDWSEQARDLHGDLPRPEAYTHPYNFIRKMACNFGWDWGPSLPTAGIWRPVYLEAWSVARLAGVRPHATVESGVGQVAVDVEVERYVDAGLTVVARVGDVKVESPMEEVVRLRLEIDDPPLWWPHTHGDQPLHLLTVELRDDEGATLDGWSRQIGFRTVEIDTTQDKSGSRWKLVVNGKPIWVRGANWIPDDCFPARVGRHRYRSRLDQAAAANLNLVRVWGGGIYESDAFYELCDERGIMVWQDFGFACAAYPETKEFQAEVKAEAIDNITRLMSHSSLVLWNGNNENLWGQAEWGWEESLQGRPWGELYYRAMLPAILARLDPTRPYIPGSPYSPGDHHPNDPDHGVMHIWDVWNQVDYLGYRAHRPRFAAEFGFQAPPTWSTLTEAIGPDITPESLAPYQKADDGMAKLDRSLRAHFGIPEATDDWHYLTQVNQARAVSLAIEHLRSLKPHCWGAIVWQLNDCWPAVSWSAVDGAGRLKPMWYALRAANADRLVTVQPGPDGIEVVAIEDTGHPWSIEVSARRVSLDGHVLASESFQAHVGGDEVFRYRLGPAVAEADDLQHELLVVDVGDLRHVWRWQADHLLDYPPARWRARAQADDQGYLIDVEAETLLVDLAVFPDRLDPAAVVDDMLVTLLPGEKHRFRLRTEADLDPELLTRPPVLRSVNDVARWDLVICR